MSSPSRRRWWLAALATLLGLPPLLALIVLAAALEREPRVAPTLEVQPEDVARAVSLVRTHDPRLARPGAVSTALLQARDLEVLISHGARRWVEASGRVTLQARRGTLLLSTPLPSTPLPDNPFGRWLNLELELEETGGLPQADRIRVGRVPVPAWLVEWAAPRVAARLGLAREWQLAGEVVRRVRFRPGQLLVTYAWQGDSLNRLFDGLLTADELQRLRPYSDLVVSMAGRSSSWQMPMVAMLQPLFELARTRTAAGADAASENRAALLVLTLYANRQALGSVSRAAQSWPRPRPLRLQLAGRDDFPLHFLISALIAAEGTTPLSKAVGIYKEIADSRGGSGFSFNDIAADRAGTRFGERAVRDAAALQSRLAQPLADSDLMPPWEDLPEFMPEADFKQRFGGVGAAPYNAMISEIDRRVAALGIFR
jgi:hypothetical protein